VRLIISSDWQASLTNLSRLRVHVSQLVELLKQSRRTQNTIFVHCGDVKEHFNPCDVRVTNFIIEAFGRIKEHCSGILYVRGNHDSITTQDDVPSIIPLIESLGASAADTDWVKIPVRLLTWNPRVVRYCLIYMVPYFRDADRQKKAFANAAADARSPIYKDPTCDGVGRDNVKILCFHNEVFGCKQSLHTMGKGYTIADLGAKQYNVCVGGHIHFPQFIPPNIYFAGSPFPMTWGEANTRHRILSITIDESRK
jgi:DNA repair exonuclease SbcCD nuclease subunit